IYAVHVISDALSHSLPLHPLSFPTRRSSDLGDPVLYGNLPPREISMKDVFRSGDSSNEFKIAEGQWYRYAPSYVSPAYHLLEGLDRRAVQQECRDRSRMPSSPLQKSHITTLL